MSQIVIFIRSIYLFLLFLLIEGVAIGFYINSEGESQAQILAYTGYLTGQMNTMVSNASNFLTLQKENEMLHQRVAQLESEHNRLKTYEEAIAKNHEVHEPLEAGRYEYIPARVISNSVSKSNNYITLDIGTKDGAAENMAVITPSGEMLGYISGISSGYSVATSVLSKKFKSSGKLLKGNEFGSLSWDGKSRYIVRLSELSKYANIQKGDTIVSTGFSQIFPEGIVIGFVNSYELNQLKTGYEVDIQLAANIASIDRVLVVVDHSRQQVKSLFKDID